MVEGMKNRPPARSSIEPLEARIVPATFTVTTAADSGAGSLRQAILDANALAGSDRIIFTDQFLNAGVPISLVSELPAISDSIEIFGDELRKVQLDGTNAGDGANGLVFAGSISGDVRGLEISGFDGDGIVVGNATGYSFSRCEIHDNSGNGIRIFGSTDLSFFFDTVINNGGTGILVEDSSGIKIGTRLTPDPITSFNTIEGNGLFGVVIRGGNENSVGANKIRGNGALAEAGEGGGIAIINAQNTNIGDFCRTGFRYSELYILGNTIEANHGVGVLIDRSSGTELTGNTITANASDGVHLDAASNTKFAVRETNYVFDRKIDRLVGNTIAVNEGWGVAAVNGSSLLDIRGNAQGPNADGGILLDGVNGAVIGGTTTYYNSRGDTKVETSSDRNIIGSGSQPGVVIKDGSGISLISNQFSGAGLPIDLGGDGATLNDIGDDDAGANHLQNYPVLTFVPAVGSNPNRLTGMLDTDAPSTKFLVQAYAYDAAMATYSVVGTQEITTDSSGDGNVSFSGLNGTKFFATATNLTTGETSEMSAIAPEALRIDVASTSLLEGDNGLKDLIVTVSLNKASDEQVSVTYGTTDGSAVAGADYSGMAGTLVFAPGETTKTITIPIVGDSVKEAAESFYVDLSGAQGALIVEGRGEVKIVNDDRIPTISIEDAVVREDSSYSHTRPGYTEYKYTISLSGSSLDSVTVLLKSVGGTATVGEDYEAVDELVTFAPGETSVTKTVFLRDDELIEASETVQFQLSEASAGVIGAAAATVTIQDDEIRSFITISKGGRQAQWSEADGDPVKLVISKPVLSFDSFLFWQAQGANSELKGIMLPAGKGSPVSLHLRLEKDGFGDGVVGLATIDASGRDLGLVRVEGNLGSILAGDSNLKTPGIRELVVDSFGSHPGHVNLTKLESVVQGGIDVFRVKHDFADAHLDVRGGKLGSLKIGGNMSDSLITVSQISAISAARVGQVSVRGDWMTSSLAVGASAGVDEIFGSEDDVLTGGLLSKIARITIGGIIAGTPEAENATDHFGFVAGKIAAFQVGKTRLPVSGSEPDVIALGDTADVTLRELSEPTATANSLTAVFAQSDRRAAAAWLRALGR